MSLVANDLELDEDGYKVRSSGLYDAVVHNATAKIRPKLKRLLVHGEPRVRQR